MHDAAACWHTREWHSRVCVMCVMVTMALGMWQNGMETGP
jgi:hypothetical protein